MLQVVVRVGPHKVNERTILHRDGDGEIVIANPERTGSMSESTIIRACALSRTTQKRDSRVSSFNVGTIIWPDGDLGETIGAKATEDALNGFNVSIFAYGPTGSDKKSSLFGVPKTSSSARGDLGLLNKICGDLLHRGDSVVSSIGVSFIEIHNGRVRSLLQGGACGLRARQNGDLDSFDTVKVESLDHFQELMMNGLLERQKSSKCHSVMSFKVEAADGRITRVNMVDLAGSERGSTGRESLQVRRDLSNLGAVLRGISSCRKTAAIPFRESPLTSLLKHSLSVRARTTVLATVSSSPSSYSENMNTLKYAQLLHVTANGGRTDVKPLDDNAIQALVTELQGADKGSRREVFRQVTSDPRQVLAKAMKVERSPEEVEDLEEERSRSCLEEEKENCPAETLVEEEQVENHGEYDSFNDFQMLHSEEKEAEEEVKGENWLAEEDLEDSEGNRMALSRRRAGRVEQTILTQNIRKGRSKRKAVMTENTAGLEENACVVDKRRRRNARKAVIEGLKVEIAALKLQLIQQRAAYASRFAEERQHRLKEREEEDKARARVMEQHREREVPRRAHAPRYMRILWVFGVVLGTFGLLSVIFMLYLNATYGRKVI